MGTPERRRETRLALPKGSVSGFRGSGKILDISPTGVKVLVNTRCVFARGELHRLVLSDLLETVEVEGQVRWTQSNWRNSRKSQESEYFQTAGLAFSRLISDQPAGIWSGLLGEMAKPTTEHPAEESAPPEPTPAQSAPVEPAPVETATQEAPPSKTVRLTAPLEMIEPIDGSTIDQQSINVVCTLHRPEIIADFRINGIEAFVMGDLGTASIKLQKGENRIVAMVSRRDGTYSTYLVGRITRSTSH